MRVLSSAAQTEIAKQHGIEPINIIGVKWDGTNEIKYADKDLTGIVGKILELSNLDEVIKAEGSGNSASISVTLDDTDGALKNIINTIDIHKKPVTVYQYFGGLSIDDAFAIFHGEINSPISWIESERKLSFSVLTRIESEEVGFAPEEGQFSNVSTSLLGTVWPLGFGHVMHVPAAKSVEKLTGATETLIGIPDYTLPYKYWHLIDRLNILNSGFIYYKKAISYLSEIAPEIVEIQDNYIQIILEEDPLKQEHEDLAKAIEEIDKKVDKVKALIEDNLDTTFELANSQVLYDYFLLNPLEDAVDQASVIAGLDYLRVNGPLLQEKKDRIQEVTRNLQELAAEKELVEIDADNAEYSYKKTKEILKKIETLIINYHKTQRELYKLLNVAEEHAKLPGTYLIITNGDKFPQGVLTRILVNGMTFLGIFSGKYFSVSQVQARYYGIQIAGRQTNEIDAFWITDPNIDLKGHFCLIAVVTTVADPDYDPTQPIRWRIFKVRDQIGTKCLIDLVELKETKAIKQAPAIKPILEDLPSDIWEALDNAQEHTDGEQVRLLENAIEKYQRVKLDKIRNTLDKIKQVVLDEDAATLNDDLISVINETIYKDINEYNDIVASLRFPKEVVEKVEEKISDHEFKQLLRLENLRLQRVEQESEPETVQLVNKFYYLEGREIVGAIYAASPTMLPSWFQFSPGGEEVITNRTMITLPNGNQINANFLPDSTLWLAEPGSPVELANDESEKFIINILPSTVKAVYAFKASNGIKQLVPLPKQYYTVNSSDTSYPPLTVTSITLKKPLNEYPGEGWSNEVYVSYESSIGPNVVDIIEWIIDNYTNLSADATSFTAVHTKLANYPAHFALFEKKDAIGFIEEIAWQSRCTVWLKNNVVYIRYLSEEPSSVASITMADIEEGTLQLEHTGTEDIVTKFIALWQPNYGVDKKSKLVLRHNVNKYGTVPTKGKEFDFYIYNIESLVLKSATFWLIRYANTWKRAKFNVFLNKLAIETFDCVLLDFSPNYFANSDIKSIVESANYDSASNTINMECWIPVRSGEMVQYDFAWPAGIAVDKLYPSVEEINAGNAGNAANSRVPKNLQYRIDPNINLVDQLDLRPKDYGSTYPSDLVDIGPLSPLLNLSESDYIVVKPEDYTLPDQPRLAEEGKPGYIRKLQGVFEPNNQPQVFMARISEVVDATEGRYKVKDSAQQTYEIVQKAGNAEELAIGAIVTAVKNSITNEYEMNESSVGTNEFVNKYAEVSLDSSTGAATTYLVNIFDDTTFEATSRAYIETNSEALQQGTLKSFYHGELVVVSKRQGLWYIQKLFDSKYKNSFEDGQIAVRLFALISGSVSSSLLLTTTYAAGFKSYSSNSISGNSEFFNSVGSSTIFLSDECLEYNDAINLLDTTVIKNVAVLIKSLGYLAYGTLIRDCVVPIIEQAHQNVIYKSYKDVSSISADDFPQITVSGDVTPAINIAGNPSTIPGGTVTYKINQNVTGPSLTLPTTIIDTVIGAITLVSSGPTTIGGGASFTLKSINISNLISTKITKSNYINRLGLSGIGVSASITGDYNYVFGILISYNGARSNIVILEFSENGNIIDTDSNLTITN